MAAVGCFRWASSISDLRGARGRRLVGLQEAQGGRVTWRLTVAQVVLPDGRVSNGPPHDERRK